MTLNLVKIVFFQRVKFDMKSITMSEYFLVSFYLENVMKELSDESIDLSMNLITYFYRVRSARSFLFLVSIQYNKE